MSSQRVLVVCGPTASGKSALALALAERFDGVLINADSMQVYRDLAIVTARPDDREMARAPHRLYGFLDVAEKCSAGQWRSLALAEIAAAGDAGRLPVVVGGTGLYLKALMSGLHDLPVVPAQVRDALMGRLDSEGPEALHAELSRIDPETASRLAPADRQRIVRALEVVQHTGRGLADWQRSDTDGAPPGLDFRTVLLNPPREDLYAACDARFVKMLSDGASDEVGQFVAGEPPADAALWKAVGVKPLARFLAGEIDESEMTEQAQRDTRRYAKRQLTWFRNQIVAETEITVKYSDIKFDEFFSKISNL